MIHFLYSYFLTRKPKLNKSKLNLWLHWQLYKFLKLNLITYYKNISKDSLGIDDDSPVIVSLTSFPSRIDVVYLAIRSILNQTRKPQKVLLWLGKEQFPDGEGNLPNTLKDLKPLGLEIIFCTDIKAHKKYFFAFQKYSDNLIVTIDDDVIYPNDLLNTLLVTHKAYPNCVVANRVRYMEMENSNFIPYRKWKINSLNNTKPSKYNFATGVGGVLYHPMLFNNKLYDLDGIKLTNCIADDIWLKASEIDNNVPVVFTNFYFKQFIEIPESQEENLYSTNVFEADNDRQIKEIFEYFSITEKSFE